ncbi:Anaphase-promoting complex subunit 4 WD40 domain-containing protein [Madurella fahalii]|uniref:Anaphase-promoting complex subunit 4 WD40 domain-containing protein n=1 Tax=Madurella fahalii TaxID=1157608 RepID=A0ABQ0GE50_9PEZI
MDPYAHAAEGTDENIAERFGRLSMGGPGAKSPRHAPSMSSLDERYDGRRRIPSGGVPVPCTPDSAWYPGQEEGFRMPNYDFRQRPTASPPVHTTPRAPSFHRKDSYASERRPSRGSSAGYSLYPASKPPTTKPLPPIPLLAKPSSRHIASRLSQDGSDAASRDTSRYSQSSRSTNTLERVPTSNSAASPTSPTASAPPPLLDEFRARFQAQLQEPHNSCTPVALVPWKQLVSEDKGSKPKDPSIYFFDISTTSATLASKHGNNIIRIWSVGSGEVQSNIKISCYTTAQARSREYFVRSHAILSEPSNLIAVATCFGDTLEIWDWGRKKKLQTIDGAERWAAVRSNVMEAGWCPLVTYHGDNDTLDLYAPTRSKKPFKKSRTIDFRAANLPVMPKYPELAFSATGPLLVTASGPRPPRLGHPPPERETLLVAWEIHDSAPANTPYKVVAPWQHAELDTALPSGLATYGSVAVSIWIPASYKAVPVPAARGGSGYNLAPVPVPYRHVLVWDFSAASTKTFRIPNAASCVSPDCRFVAYCDARGVESGARGCLAVLDAMTGRMLWCWPDPEAGPSASGVQPGFEQLGDLSKVTEMCFSADGGFLFVGDSEGGIGVFEVREMAGGGGVGLRGVAL